MPSRLNPTLTNSENVLTVAAAMTAKPRTAVEIAEIMDCSKSQAYKLVREVQRRVAVESQPVRFGERGPLAVAYRISIESLKKLAH